MKINAKNFFHERKIRDSMTSPAYAENYLLENFTTSAATEEDTIEQQQWGVVETAAIMEPMLQREPTTLYMEGMEGMPSDDNILLIYIDNNDITNESNDNESMQITNDDGPTRKKRQSKVTPNKSASNVISERKLKRNSGQEYIGTGGRLVSAKQFENRPCKCRLDCDGRISAKERKILFDTFWDLKDFNLQNISLRGMVKAEDIERHRATDNSRGPKLFTYRYELQANLATEPLRVCKKYFMNTFQISHGRLYRLLSKPALADVVDARGKPGDNKEQVLLRKTHVERHISQFPIFKEHFLSATLTVRKMYDLYVEECEARKVKPLSENYYYHVLDTKLNICLRKDAKEKYLKQRRRKQLLRRYYTRNELLRIVTKMVHMRKEKHKHWSRDTKLRIRKIIIRSSRMDREEGLRLKSLNIKE